MSRPSSKSQYIGPVKEMYLDQKMSLGEISSEIGVSIQTLSRWLQSEGIRLEVRKRNPNANRTPEQQEEINRKISRTRQQNLRTGASQAGGRTRTYEDVERACPECHSTFSVRENSTQIYCGRQCARQAAATTKSLRTMGEWYDSDASLCPCGKRIPYTKRDTSKYCSDECRSRYGKKRQPDPNKQVTFNCGTCGKETTRPRSYGATVSGMRFCDNTCAAKHTKTVRHYVVREMDMVLDSGWEMLFAGLCYWHKLEVVRVDRTLAVTTGSGSAYAPDFIVGDSIAVEVKGLDRGNQDEGRELWRETMGPLAVVDRQIMALLIASESAGEMLDTLDTDPIDPVASHQPPREEQS